MLKFDEFNEYQLVIEFSVSQIFELIWYWDQAHAFVDIVKKVQLYLLATFVVYNYEKIEKFINLFEFKLLDMDLFQKSQKNVDLFACSWTSEQ